MNRLERADLPEESMIAVLRSWQSDLWTALPGIVQSFDPVKQTCTVQPAIRARFKSPATGKIDWIQLPVLQDCPVVFPAGGGCTLTFPIVIGDECLVVFASRCIDAWWKDGGIQNQALFRLHDLSDGFAFVGVNSNAKVPSNISTTETQLRSNDGVVSVSLNAANHSLKLKAATVQIEASDNVSITSPITNITGQLKNNGLNVGSTHTHGGVQTGANRTQVPS